MLVNGQGQLWSTVSNDEMASDINKRMYDDMAMMIPTRADVAVMMLARTEADE